MNKPREWWIDADDFNDYFECFVSTKDPKTLSDDDDYVYMKDRDPVHVIEKSAYNALETELKEARTAEERDTFKLLAESYRAMLLKCVGIIEDAHDNDPYSCESVPDEVRAALEGTKK